MYSLAIMGILPEAMTSSEANQKSPSNLLPTTIHNQVVFRGLLLSQKLFLKQNKGL